MVLAACAGTADDGDLEPDPIVLFECGNDARRVRLLGRYEGELVFESWTANFPSITVEEYMWSDVRLGRVSGQQGGHQTHVRLDAKGTQYILFEGEDGQLTDNPGRTYAGVVKLEGGPERQPAFEISCPSTDLNRRVVRAVREYRRQNGKRIPLEEDAGGGFDAWY